MLKEILKDRWGFDGLVVSDWIGTYSTTAANGGLDLEMPGPGRWMGAELVRMVESGEIPEAELDDKLRRLLRTIERTGAREGEADEPEIANDRPEHRQLIRRAGAEAIVLLKNERDILPLDPEGLGSIAVIGEAAQVPAIMGGGSSEITPHYAVSLLDALREELPPSVNLEYAPGCSLYRALPLMDFSWLVKDVTGEQGLTVEYFSLPDFSGAAAGRWFTSRPEITFADEILEGVNPQRFSARLSGELAAPASGDYTFGLSSNLACRMWIGDVLLFSSYASEPGKDTPVASQSLEASAELVAGQTYRIRIEASWEGALPWRELVIRCAPPVPSDQLQRAVEVARRADVVILVAGTNKEWESEGFDLLDMLLPGAQDELIRSVLEVNANTVVVLNTGSPVEMPWLSGAAAVVQAWYLGQESGHALADVLFGLASPGGRLPITFPRRLQDNPTYLHYPGENGKHPYSEGIFAGYRYYQRKQVHPQFPFGFGLSYTRFVYHKLVLSPTLLQKGQVLKATFELENAGRRAGSEVVQWYVQHHDPPVMRPERWLVGFSKVYLQPGEKQRVDFEMPSEQLAYYDDLTQAWVTAPGKYTLQAGSSCEEMHVQGDFEMLAAPPSTIEPRSQLGLSSTLGALLADEHAQQVLRKHLGALVDHPQIEMALEMTLEQVAGFVPELLPREKLEIIAAELAQPQ